MKNKCSDCRYYNKDDCSHENEENTGWSLCGKFHLKADRKNHYTLDELHNGIYQIIMDCVGDHENMDLIIKKIKDLAINFSNKQKLIDKKMSDEIIRFIIKKYESNVDKGCLYPDRFADEIFDFFVSRGLAIKEKTALERLKEIERLVNYSINDGCQNFTIDSVQHMLKVANEAINEKNDKR